MKIELSVLDRIVLLRLLPLIEGNVVLLKVLRELSNFLGFNNEEIQSLNFRLEDGKTLWDPAPPREFEFDKVQFELIRRSLREGDSRGLLNLDTLPTYEKLMEDQKE